MPLETVFEFLHFPVKFKSISTRHGKAIGIHYNHGKWKCQESKLNIFFLELKEINNSHIQNFFYEKEF